MCHTYENGDAGQGLDERRQSQQMFPLAGRVSRCSPLPAESADVPPCRRWSQRNRPPSGDR